MQKKVTLEDFWVDPAECTASWGEKKRGVQKPQELKDIGRSLEEADIGKNLTFVFSTPCTPSVGGGIVNPRGGPPPPTFSCPAHGSRISLRGRTLGIAPWRWLAFLAFLAFFSIFGIFGMFSLFRRISWRNDSTNTWKSCSNPALEAPKSSFGASKIELGTSKTQFVKHL